MLLPGGHRTGGGVRRRVRRAGIVASRGRHVVTDALAAITLVGRGSGGLAGNLAEPPSETRPRPTRVAPNGLEPATADAVTANFGRAFAFAAEVIANPRIVEVPTVSAASRIGWSRLS